MGKLSAALNAIFSTSGDAGLTSSMKVPYFKSKTIDGNTAFYPDGMASMSALASVLGGDGTVYGYLKKQSAVTNYDFNTALDYGLYTITNGANWVNGPSGITKDQGILLCYGWTAGTRVSQVLITLINPGIYSRQYSKNGSTETWSPWVRVDNFGCSTPDALASLLGGIPPIKTLSSYCIYTGDGTERYIKITLPGSYYSTGFFLFGMTGGFLATGNIRIGNGNVYTVNIKNIVGEFGNSKVYYSGNEVVIDVASINQQIGLYILTNNKNVSIDKYSSYNTSGMTEVTIN